ncbi:EpsG family protein [Roseivivax halotolerans]|uniref:EpsG family protein n=1 Tax=Roseivivax halotolerans TaxID=93684 RepID=A0A1I6A2F0_9RHOB|nr:EpsG family protein [Roseivivax halotolerans]SFQ62906.1 EpsG family protein [Roseivivax halotolerans]
MFVYLGIYSGLALSAVGNYRRRNTVFFVLTAALLVWFMGFRYETGCDYLGYRHRWVHYFPPTSLAQLFQGQEAGFALLMGSVKALGLDYTWLNVAASAILVACYTRFATAHSFAPLILALLFPVIIIQLGMSGIRQALAGGFLMLSFNAFSRKERLWTAIWILIGMQFHASVVMFLPIALIAGRQINTLRLAASLAILGPVAGLLLADRFETYESRYIEGAVTSGGAIIRYALILLPVPFFVTYRASVRRQFPDVYPLLKMAALIILALAPLAVLSSIALHRLNYYVMPLSILLLVYVGAIAFRRARQGHILAAGAYGAYSLFWFMGSSHAQSCYLPYENTWFL